MKEITLHDRYSLAEIGKVEVMNEPVINEEINGGYTLNITLDYLKKSLLHKNALLLVDGQYFQISTQASEHSATSLSVSLNCEHINYELLEDEDYQEEYEDNAYGMLSSILSGTRFTLGDVMATGTQYYKPSADTVRSRLLDVANLFGGELMFDNFTIHMVPDRRGTLESIKVELGVNQISIRENVNYIEGEVSYEIDCVDLSQIPGYEQFSKITLGDTVEMENELLDIQVRERVIAYSYNPFKRQTLSCTVGNYVNDFTKYVKEEEEEKKEENDDGILAVFRVGDVNCLTAMSDERSAVIDYITDTSLQGIIPGADIEVTENKKGVAASLKAGLNHHLTAMITTETETGIMASFKPMPSTDLTNLVLPGNNVSVSVVMIITCVPFADLASGLVPVEKEGEDFVSPLIGAFGVRLLINNNADGYLDSFKIGDVDVLRIDKSEATDVVVDFIKGNTPQPIAKTVYEVNEGKLKGIYAGLKANYKNHHLTFLYSTKGENNEWTVETRNMPFTNARIFTTPRIKEDSVIMVITKEPFENLNASNVGTSFIKAFGVKLQMAKEIFLDEFKIGDVDMLFAEGLEIENDNLASIKAEVDYTKNEEFTGLFLKLKQAYSGYTISVREYTTSGSTSSPYSDSYKTKKYPNNTVALTVTVSKDGEQQIFGFKFKKGDGQEESWLSGFRIGNIDCLALYGVQMESANPTDIMAEIEFSKEDEFTGLLLSLKEEFKDAKITVKNQSGAVIDNNSSTVLPNGNSALIVTLTKGTEIQYYGVKFTKVAFEGLITIKSKDENGKIISTIEKTYTETGTYEIFADEIDGYELVSVSPLNVKLTVEEPEKVIEFLYKATELPELPTTGLVMETASSQYVSDLTFNFTKSYSQVVSVVTTSSTGAVVSYSLIQGTDGGYKGVKITAGGGIVSIQVVVTG